jgi:single-strand selective monofunctional uracil DNA glycosylase
MTDAAASQLIAAARALADALRPLRFGPPVDRVYHATDHARAPHETYLRKFGNNRKRVVMLGMNPGPWGMAQTGVPFGEVAAVRDWMGIEEAVEKPANEHPKRPIEGFACTRSEVSGRRLWGLFSRLFPRPQDFFRDHFVLNYCPLIWMSPTGANITPDKLPAAEMAPVDAACDIHLDRVLDVLRPEILVGIGGFAEAKLAAAANRLGTGARVGRVLHPSPASPAANRGWDEAATRQLTDLGVLTS